ncbi:MAG: hypothetical protein ACRDRH_30120 [Pseudonocardia sp.]
MVELVAPAAVPPDAATGATSRDAMSESLILWMTCVVDGHEHAVTDEQAAAGFELGRGTYGTVCGRTMIPHAMTQEPGRRCTACAAPLRVWCSPSSSRRGST